MSKEDKQRAIQKSKNYMSCKINAAATIDAMHGHTMDVDTITVGLCDSLERIKKGNLLEVEAMLLSQAHTLNIFFNQCLRRAADANMMGTIQAFSDLALRAQNNCRKTLLTLAEVKNPKRSTFIAQQNNAIGNQQINNSEKIKKSANEVLTEKQNAQLDDRRTETTISINPSMEAVEKIERSKNK